MLRPLDTVSVPPTVQVVVAARIDRLPDREKALLQTASVIGRRFSEEVRKEVAGWAETDLLASLSMLDRRDFVHQESLYPEVEWAFKHPLTQEAAYRSQLSERRKELHAAVARAIQDTYPDKFDERASELAYHWEQAGEALAAARWHRRAAEWLWMPDVPRSFEHFARVRALTAELLDEAEAREHGLRARFMLLNAGWRVHDLDLSQRIEHGVGEFEGSYAALDEGRFGLEARHDQQRVPFEALSVALR
jgi:predicted ATPase